MNYSGKVYAKIGGRYVPLDATAEEIDKWKEAYESQPKQLSDEESLWDTLNAVISSHYGDCSSLPELIDGFGVRKDGRSLSLWEAIKVALDEIEAYRDRTGGGVDLEKELNDYAQHVLNQPTIGHTENALGSKGIKGYLSQRNQQEKG